jgi:hypothetical protein
MKKWNLVTLSLLCFTLLANPAFATGGRSDGGGNVVVCFQSSAQKQKIQKQFGVIENSDLGNIESIDLLEIYDMKVRYAPLNNRTLMTPKSDSAVSEAQSVFDEFKKNIVNTSADLDKTFNLVLHAVNDGQTFLNQPLRRQNDSNEVVNYDASGRCTLSTLAIQAGDQDFFELSIDGRLWNHPKFSTLNKIALIFHETFYKMDRDKGAIDSLRAQRTNQMLLSTMNNETRSQWLGRVSRYGIISGKSPDVVYAKVLYETSYYEGTLQSRYFLIPENTSHEMYLEYMPGIQSMVQYTREGLAKIAKDYLVSPALVARAEQILSGFAQQNENTHNSYVEAQLGYSFSKPIPNPVQWFSKVPGFDQFQQN